MVAIPSRHKSLVLLAGVILIQVLALAIQIKAREAQGDQAGMIRGWTVGFVSPFERTGAWTIEKIRGAWDHYFALSDTAKENERLRQENQSLKLAVNELQTKAEEGDRLAALLRFRESHRETRMIAARVIGTSAEPTSLVVYVDRGQRDGVRKDMGVITPDGVVGKISEVYGRAAQVLLLSDKDSGVGAMIADSRIQSPVGGMGEPLLNMKYVANDDEVKVGERVVTSGMDRIFPKDLPVGTVVEVKPGMPFKKIRVQPAANLERLEEVIILPSLESFEMIKASPKAEAAATEPGESKSEAEAEKPGSAVAAPEKKPTHVKRRPEKVPEQSNQPVETNPSAVSAEPQTKPDQPAVSPPSETHTPLQQANPPAETNPVKPAAKPQTKPDQTAVPPQSKPPQPQAKPNNPNAEPQP